MRAAVLAAPALVALAVFVLWRRLDVAAWSAALAHLRSYPFATIADGILLVAISLALLGGYEALMLRELGRPMGWARPAVIAICANVIGHSLGLAALSGGALRYRFYTAAGLNGPQIGAMVALSTMPFLLGISCLLSVALLVHSGQAAAALHAPAWLPPLLGAIGLLLNAGYLLLVATRRQLSVGRHRLPLPRASFTAQQLVVGAAEIFCVATLLYILMPAELGLGLMDFMTVFLIAVIVGQISSVPAGLGVLEASLLLLLPHIPAAQLLGSVLAYRVLFEVLPLLLAFLLWAAYEWHMRRQARPAASTSGR